MSKPTEDNSMKLRVEGTKMPTIIKNQNVRRAFSALFLLALLVSMFGGTVGRLDLGMVSIASACQTGKPCEDAAGSPTIQEPKEDKQEVTIGDTTVTVTQLVNNGGHVMNDNAVAGGVLTQAITGTNNATASVTAPAGSDLQLPVGTNVTVTYAEEDESILTLADEESNFITQAQSNLSGGNPHWVPPTNPLSRDAFKTQFTFECGGSDQAAAHNPHGCGFDFPISNLYMIKADGSLKLWCRDSSNANVFELKDTGGWKTIIDQLYAKYLRGQITLGATGDCRP